MHVEGVALGLSGKCPNVTFLVGVNTVVGDRSTDYDKKCDDLRNGRSVEVDGRRQSNGSIAATRIEIPKDDDDDQ